ncbi:redox-sensing transcriptional repressor Rex [Sinomonas gamaensis]|jgi:redox-sensing transcriptional repressor|uniref:redox-sensing transcriptional repressor Rex n=1 Tax=Sinomonas gamaensis TaxID=2565624 RepID=UPI0011084D38|nr:redox-sensing transcriptional repressor Rex [Sinomonas gamaensis]
MTSHAKMPDAEPAAKRLPSAVVARLTIYLRALNGFVAEGVERVSSDELAEASGVSSATLRKDLSQLGSYGTRGVGYEVENLLQHLSAALGLTRDWRVAIVGAGNLGRALARYGGFETRGFEVVALLDTDPQVIGNEVGWLRVTDAANLEAIFRRTKANMAVLALPGSVAQEACDRVVAAGVRSILSFAPTILQVPRGVTLRKVDMATELQILAYHAQRGEAGGHSGEDEHGEPAEGTTAD